MKRVFTLLSLVAVFGIGSSANAQSSKATAAINTLTVSCGGSNTTPTTCANQWVDVMDTTIKTSNVADLFANVSLVTGLYTSTNVKGNGSGSTSTSVAQGTIEVRVLLDDQPGLAYPDTTGDGIIFDQRIQTLSANLGYVFTDCFANGGNTGTGCTLTPEQITLVLDTTAAHSFAFILPDVGVGNHTLRIQARSSTSTTGTDPVNVAIANAVYGLGSLTVESVRLVNSFSF